MTFDIISAVSCSVPNVQNAIRQPDADIIHYPSSVTFTCEDGYLFPDGSASQDRSCENTGELSGELHECAGMYMLVQSFISKHAFVIVFCRMFAF